MRKTGPLRQPEGLSGGGEVLPTWNLGDLYGGTADPRIEADLQAARRDAEAFESQYRLKLATLNGAAPGGGDREL